MDKIIKSKLFLILILASLLRLLFLAKVPPALNWDEVSMGYSAYSLSLTGADEWGNKMPLFFRSYGEWKSPVYIYLLVPFIKIFGLNAWGVRLPAAIAGILAVYLTYLIGKRLYGEHVGLWSAFFLAVSPWHLMLSRPGFEAGVALAAILAGIYFFLQSIKYVEGKQLKFYILYTIFYILFFGLAPYTYNSAKVVVPLLVVILLYLKRSEIGFKRILLILTALFVIAIPILSSIKSGVSQKRYAQVGITTDAELTEKFYEYRKTFPAPPVVSRVIFSKYSFFVVKLIDNYFSYLTPNFLIISAGNRPQHSIPYHGVLYFSEFAFLCVGIWTFRKKQDSLKYLPFFLIGLGIIPAATTKEPYHVLRSILTIPGWQFLAGLGMTHLQKIKFSRLKVVNLLLFVEVSCFMLLYFTWYPRAFAREWQFGYKEVIEYITKLPRDYDQIIFTKWYGEPQLFLAFYSQMDPYEYQRKNKDLIRYENQGLSWLDQLDTYQIGNYTFQYLEWHGQGDDRRNLYIGKDDDFWPETDLKKTIYFPDSSVAFKIVEAQ